ncbi:unnamed protein product [Bursaphelenchus okinawaensis]|uniref:LIM zinc-binding domain-containing protein n=1 Tax=Bursaphelenchus okinawaensis TaxID=465554 RepID=A0A811LK42_9BILA|nr:unnamed protein product [Bursaphelenchus okinawaensis]CAG9123383.1 unnamed protein product [Bursaphelenchus okinawaensis]
MERKFYKPIGHDLIPLGSQNLSSDVAKFNLHKNVLDEKPAGYKCGAQKRQKWVVRCESCQLIITREQALKSNVVFTLNKFWHREHLTCIRCNAAVGADRLEFRQCKSDLSKPICIDCYMEENHPSCDGCHKPLKERAISAMGHQFHKCCFVCTKCRGPMPNNEYYVLHGLPYDVDCYFLKKYESVINTGANAVQSPAANAYTSDSSSTVTTTSSKELKPTDVNDGKGGSDGKGGADGKGGSNVIKGSTDGAKGGTTGANGAGTKSGTDGASGTGAKSGTDGAKGGTDGKSGSTGTDVKNGKDTKQDGKDTKPDAKDNKDQKPSDLKK